MAVVWATETVPPLVEAAINWLAGSGREHHGDDYAVLQEATQRPVAWADAA
jgi:hypothetical protein